MAVAGQVVVRILGENSSAVRSIKEVNRELESSRRAFERDFGEVAKMAQRGAFAVGAAVAAMGVSVGVLVSKANDAFDALDASERRLGATAKFVGADLAYLQQTSEQLSTAFGLSTRQANDLTAEVARLTSKAGDITQTADAMRAFLDLGASRGLGAQETLEAVRQAILGIDEGTDKLFGVNPSVLYKEFADQVGKSAGALTDEEKALAIVHAALEYGGRVRGEYLKFLESAPGQQSRLNAELEDAAAAFGEAVAPLRLEALRLATKAVAELARVLADNRDNIEGFVDALIKAGRAVPEYIRAGHTIITAPFNPTAVPRYLLGRARRQFEQQREALREDELRSLLGPVMPAVVGAQGARGVGGTSKSSTSGTLTEADKKALDERVKVLQQEIRVFHLLNDEAIKAAAALDARALGLPGPDPRAAFLARVAEAGADPFGVGTATGRIASFFATGKVPLPPGYQSVEDRLQAGIEASVKEARAFLPVDRLDELFFAPVEEGVDGLADAGATAVATFGAMAEAAIVGSDQMASAVIHGFSRILQSLPGIGGLGGAVIGALGGIVGAIFNRSKSDPLPVRVEDYGERAKTEHRQTRQGPDRVTIRFIDPRTGGQVDEVEYVLGRRERVDGVPRFSDLGV